MTLNTAAELVINSGQPIGQWGIGGLVPVVTFGSGVVTSTYGATFDYQVNFSCDLNGYRNIVTDLAWLECWAADHGGTNYFYCGKVKAIGIPMSNSGPPYPTYVGVWSHLGAGRSYDLYLKYRLKTGDESQLSAAFASSITNSGAGVSSMASNPAPLTSPVVSSFSVVATLDPGDVAFGLIFDITLSQPNAGWLKSLVFYVTPTYFAIVPNAQSQPFAIVPIINGGVYTNILLQNIPAGQPFNIGIGTPAYSLYVAYQDNAGNISSPTLAGYFAGNPLSFLLGFGSFAMSSGSGAPSGAPSPNTVPAIYFNTAGTHGSMIYAWNGTTWSAFA